MRDAARDTKWIGASPIGGDVRRILCAIEGPSGTPDERSIFFLGLCFQTKDQFNHTHIKFLTRVYHPNVDSRGKISVNFMNNMENRMDSCSDHQTTAC